MGVPVGNGLVEITGEKSSDRGFFCMKLIGYITEEMDAIGDRSWEFWHGRFHAAETGSCPYRHKCPKYAATVATFRHAEPIQLTLDF